MSHRVQSLLVPPIQVDVQLESQSLHILSYTFALFGYFPAVKH